jgi:isoleucyl-tRNA synthetase
MQHVRDIVSKGLEVRQKAGIKVRQPLASISVNEDMLGLKDSSIMPEHEEIIKDELNVKEIKKGVHEEGFILDTVITPELKKEGDYRELVRAVQDMRKKMELTPSDRISITISKEGDDLVSPFIDEFKKTVQADNVTFSDNDGTEIKIDDKVFNIIIEK